MKGTRNNQIKQFCNFPFLYMTLAVDKLNGHGISNTSTVHCECLPKKNNNSSSSKGDTVLATEGLPDSTNKSEHFLELSG